jgi:outer membrane protein W
MRKTVLVLLGLLAVSASAQTPEKATRVSFFLTNPGFGWSEGGGSNFDAGFGLALEQRFTPQWSAELEVAREVHDYQPSFFDPRTIEFRTYPVDVFVRYSFENNTRWRPFLGAGARYVTAPDEPSGADYDSELSPEIGGGVEWEAGESLSIVFDAKALAKNEVPHWDEVFKVSVGVGWRF